MDVAHLPACAQTFRFQIRSSAEAQHFNDAFCILRSTAAEERCCQCLYLRLAGHARKLTDFDTDWYLVDVVTHQPSLTSVALESHLIAERRVCA